MSGPVPFDSQQGGKSMQITDSRDFKKQTVWNEDFSRSIYFLSGPKPLIKMLLGLRMGRGSQRKRQAHIQSL